MSEIENYLAPNNLDEALKVMADGDVTVLCGGTDLALQTDSGLRKYAGTLINIRRIDGLAEIDAADGKIRIGALTTVSEIKENQMINELAPVLVAAADQFASDQIRNAASLGGNICNASPAGDMIIPLLVWMLPSNLPAGKMALCKPGWYLWMNFLPRPARASSRTMNY